MLFFRQGERVKKRWDYKKIFIASVSVLGLLLIMFFAWYTTSLRAIDSNSEEQIIVTVEQGMNEAQIAAVLESRGIIRSAIAYEIYARINGKVGNMQAGGYKLSKNMSVADIVGKFTNGDIAIDLLTILPAQRLDQIELAFIESGYSEAEVETALNPAQYIGHPALSDKPPLASLEGYLYPESFQHIATTPLETIVRASLDQMALVLTPTLRQQIKDRNLTVHQAVILASMVEKEVDNVKDMPTVAQVFELRYKKGIMLGSDVTAIYGALNDGVDLPEDYEAAESVAIAYRSPYNTRIFGGLPPGPISNISASSLQAVASPSDTDFLFFVAGDDKVTYFSKTVEEHNALAAEHCKRCLN